MHKVFILILFASLLAGTQSTAEPKTGPPSAIVEAKLTAISKVPTPKDLSTYRESLIGCRWEVTKVNSGTVKDKEIVVFHWSYLDYKFQEATKWKVGETRTLTLRPFAEVPLLARLRKDEDATIQNLDLPVFYDTALGNDLPPVLALALTSSKILDVVRKQLGNDLSLVKAIGAADCHGVSLSPLYGGQVKGVKGPVFSVAGPGTFFTQHELGYRVAAGECLNLEWGIQSGGTDRPFGGFTSPLSVTSQPFRLLAGPA